MPVRKLGIKWAVFTEAGEFVDMFACRGEAKKKDAELEAADVGVEAQGEAPEGECIGGEEKPQEGGAGGAEKKEAEAKPDGYPCPHCDFVSKAALGLQSHLRAKHGGMKK